MISPYKAQVRAISEALRDAAGAVAVARAPSFGWVRGGDGDPASGRSAWGGGPIAAAALAAVATDSDCTGNRSCAPPKGDSCGPLDLSVAAAAIQVSTVDAFQGAEREVSFSFGSTHIIPKCWLVHIPFN